MATVLTDLRAERYVDTVHSAGKDRLCVDANLTGSITIGAVSIEDPDTGLTVDIRTVGDLNALIVYDADELQKTRISEYGSSIISASGTDIPASYTVPSGKNFFWTGVIVGGEEAGEFQCRIDSTDKALIRNAGADRTKTLKFPEALLLSESETADIRITNIGHKTKSFEVTIMGYIRSV